MLPAAVRWSMAPSQKVSLLIAEDDERLRQLIQAAALRAGVFDPIRLAEDGERALALARTANAPPELIVSDLSMPRMTGIDLIRALKSDESTRSIPVAVITSSDLPNDREDALNAGACAFLPKPIGFEALTQLLLSLRESCCEPSHAR